MSSRSTKLSASARRKRAIWQQSSTPTAARVNRRRAAASARLRLRSIPARCWQISRSRSAHRTCIWSRMSSRAWTRRSIGRVWITSSRTRPICRCAWMRQFPADTFISSSSAQSKSMTTIISSSAAYMQARRPGRRLPKLTARKRRSRLPRARAWMQTARPSIWP